MTHRIGKRMDGLDWFRRDTPQNNCIGSRLTCLTLHLLVTLHMNILHYLYTKGETTFNYKLNGRSFIVWPIWTFTVFFGIPLHPKGLNEFVFILIFLACGFLLYLLTYIIIPKKKVRLKTWLRKYKNTTNLWAYLYFFSPLIFFGIYLIIKFN